MSFFSSLVDMFKRPRAGGGRGFALWPEQYMGKPEWTSTNVETYLREGFETNSLIYSAIMYKVRATSSVVMRAYTGSEDAPELLDTTDELAQLIAKPNQYQNQTALSALITVSLNVAGEAFVYIGQKADGSRSLTVLRPDYVAIIPRPDKTNELLGYMYFPGGMGGDGLPILPGDMIHPKFPNPSDPLCGAGHGMSPLKAAAQTIDIDNMVTAFLNIFFKSGTMNNTVITFDIPINDDDKDKVKRNWKELYGGHEKWGEPGVLDNGGKVQRLGMSFDEMGFSDIDQRNEARNIAPLGVPGILLGSRAGLQANTYGTANREARKQCWEDTLIPERQMIVDAFNAKLAGDDKFLADDYSKVPALQQNKQELINSANVLFNMGVPRDQAIATVGLKMEETPNGSVSYMPMALIPSGAEAVESNAGQPRQDEDAPAEAQSEEAPKSANKNGARLSEEAKAAHWKAQDRFAQSWEKRVAAWAVKQFDRERREVLAAVNSAKQMALSSKGTVDYDKLKKRVKRTLDESGDEWQETFVPVVKSIVETNGTRLNAQFGMQFDVRNIYSAEWFEDYALTFANEIDTKTYADMGKLLQQAQLEGWSIEEIQNAIEDRYDIYDSWRSETIARTETMRASNAGAFGLYEAWGATGKEWVATLDDSARDEHKSANGNVVDIDEPFRVGGEELQFPGDPAGSPENTINCRCTVAPVI